MRRELHPWSPRLGRALWWAFSPWVRFASSAGRLVFGAMTTWILVSQFLDVVGVTEGSTQQMLATLREIARTLANMEESLANLNRLAEVGVEALE